jgi:Flp pilus assembly protein TadD
MEETLTQNETFESRNLFIKATGSIKRGNFLNAKQYLEEAVKIAPDNPAYLSMLGLCEAKEGDISRGKSLCSRAANIAPDEPMPYVNLGKILLMEKGRRKEARDVLLKAYRIDRRNLEVAMELSRMGIRRAPVLSFLPRQHRLNVIMGKLRHYLLNWIKRA